MPHILKRGFVTQFAIRFPSDMQERNNDRFLHSQRPQTTDRKVDRGDSIGGRDIIEDAPWPEWYLH